MLLGVAENGSNDSARPSAGGQMDLMVRAHDWANTPLGPLSRWPRAVRTTVDLMLASKHGMCLVWGPELTLLYNDAYAPILGMKHPAALGRPIREVWRDVWESIEPLVEKALAGEAVWFADLHLVMERNGYPEDTWWQFSYSPARDDEGRIVGMLNVTSEMTGKVLVERRQAFRLALEERLREVSSPEAVMASAATMLGERLGAHRVGYGQVLPDDITLRLSDCYADGVERLHGDFPLDDFGPESIARQRRGETEACADVEADPRQNHAGWAAIGARAFVSVPLVREGRLVALLYANRRDAHRWSADELALIEDVASRTWAAVERARAESERRRAEQMRAAQTRILELAVQDTPLDQALEALVLEVEEISNSGALASILLLDPDGQRLRHGAGPSLPAAYNEAIEGITVGQRAGSCGAAEHRRRPVYVADVNVDPLWADCRDLARAHGLRSCWSTPILSATGAALGTFAMHHREPRQPAAADLELIDFVVRSAALLIERKGAEARLKASEAALRASEARLRFMSELDEGLRASRDAPAAMLSAAELLARRLDASRCAYADVDADSDRFVIRNDFTALGVASSAGTYSLTLFGSRAAADMRRGRTLVVGDVAGELASEDGRDMFQSIGIGAIVCCPLVKDGRLAAMMAVHQDRPRNWRDDEIALVEAVVERCWAHVERVGAEARLRESEERLRLSVENAEVGFWDVDLVRDALIWPARTKALFGISPDVPVTMADFYSGLHPDDRDKTSEAFAAAADPARRATYDVEYRTVGKEDGVVRWVAAKGRGLFDHPGPDARCLRVIGTAINISARKQAEEDLRALNGLLEQRVAERTLELRRFRDIVDATISPICAFDAEYRLIAFNKAHKQEFRRVNGFDSRLGDVFPDLFIPEQQPIMRALMTRALTGERFTVVERFGQPELGRPFWEITYTPLLDEDGRVIGAFHLAIDISDRLRAEAELQAAQEALRQSQKMEAMGQLTGGVAHDFNNLLTPIVGSLDLLQRRGVGGEREQRLISGAIQSADRAKVLVQRLLAFARRQPLQPVAVDVGALVRGMADLLASTTGPQVRVVVDVADALPQAKADPNQLEMALLNLGVNARDAMPDGGTLRITATRESVRQPRGDLKRGHYVRLSVADTGTGMDEETLARAVEPFFSTKGIGKGTGLGLSMAHGLAAQLGGALTIQSRRGIGTHVELWLPVSSSPPDATAASVEPVAPASRRGLALLVDDEDVVRASTADMLEELGYRVQEASSAEAALALVAEGAQPDLLVTDHLMPGMSGVDLARAIRRRLPELPVLIVSGYAEAEGIAPDLPRLTKPFRSAELAASVAGLTSAPR